MEASPALRQRQTADGPDRADGSAIPWESVMPARAGTLRWGAAHAIKRALDLIGASVGLVLTAPLLAVVAVLIKMDSEGPVLHRMYWVGLRGRRFSGFKLRTMVADAERQRHRLNHLNEMRGPAFKISGDPRITRVGRWLRRSSIDELPQLLNVLRGEMSLVGPRCPQVHEYAAFGPRQCLKLAVVPGLTCLWQVSGRAAITDFDEWVRLDLEYIRNWSLWLDFKILLRTIPAVLTARGAQ